MTNPIIYNEIHFVPLLSTSLYQSLEFTVNAKVYIAL